MIVSKIEHIYLANALLQEDGWVQLEKGNVLSINGLAGYTLPKLLEHFAFAGPINYSKYSNSILLSRLD